MHSSRMRTTHSLPHGGSLSMGVFVQGVSVQGGPCLGVSVWGSLSKGCLFRGGGLCPGGLCPEGEVSVQRGRSLSRGISVQRGSLSGVLCPRGLCPEGEVSVQGVSVWGSLSRGVSLTKTPSPLRLPLEVKSQSYCVTRRSYSINIPV